MYRSSIAVAKELRKITEGICLVSCKLTREANAEWMTELEVHIRNLRGYVNPAVKKIKREEENGIE